MSEDSRFGELVREASIRHLLLATQADTRSMLLQEGGGGGGHALGGGGGGGGGLKGKIMAAMEARLGLLDVEEEADPLFFEFATSLTGAQFTCFTCTKVQTLTETEAFCRLLSAQPAQRRGGSGFRRSPHLPLPPAFFLKKNEPDVW